MSKNQSLSIVIASFSSIDHLSRCLESLKAGGVKAEIIVSTCLSENKIKALQKNFDIKVVFNPDEQNQESIRLRETRVFRLRSAGVKAATGDVVMMLEDHCEVETSWLSAMQDALKDKACIVGGPIVNGADNSLFHWALFWSEYAAMMPPVPSDQISYLSAVNSAYYKSELDVCKPVWQGGFYDNEVHDALMKKGAKLCLAKEAIVKTRLPFSFKQAIVHLYTGGQRYGGYRGGKCWNLQRLIRMLATLLVPAVLTWRAFKLVKMRQSQLLLTFILCSPILYILLGAWGLGELVGTMRGETSA